MSDLTLFPVDPLPEPRSRAEGDPPFGELHERTPGWVLIATKTGPHGFHRVKSVIGQGTMRTLCGRYGRVVREEQRMITCCTDCETLDPL